MELTIGEKALFSIKNIPVKAFIKYIDNNKQF